MLQSIHNATKSWLGYAITFIMVIFLVIAFAAWGVGDIFRGGTDTTVATVGSRVIDRDTFNHEMQNQLRQMNQRQHSELTTTQAHAMGLDKVMLDRMIERVAIDARVDALGLTVSDDHVRGEIQRDENFEGANGTFDKNRFDALLQNAGISEDEYISSVRDDIKRQQYIIATVAGVGAPPRLARLIYDYVTEQRVAEYFVLAPADVSNPPEPTEAELVVFHKAHAADFSTPEYRELEYVQIGVDEVSGEIPVTEADIKASWEHRKEEFAKPEEREIEQIAFPTQAAAVAASTRIKAGTPFLTVAHDAGKTDTDVKLGTFARTAIDARLAGPAFAVPLNGVTDAVQGPFGWAILRVTKIVPDQSKTYEQMHDQLRADLIKERAAERIADVANKFEDARGSDKPLAEAATAAGLTAHRVTIDAKGMQPDGTKAAIPAAPVFLQQAFHTEAGNESELFENDDRSASYAVKVIGVRPPALKPLDSVRTAVRDAWMVAQRSKLLLARAQALTAQAQREATLTGAARAASHTPTTSAPLTRGTPGEVFSAEALAKLFAAPPNTAIFAHVGKGEGYVVARAVKVIHPPPAGDTLAGLRGEVSGQLARDVGQTIALAARAQEGVEIHQTVLQSMFGEAQ